MKKIYDKLLLATAVLALLGGVTLFVLKSGSAPDAGPVDSQPADKPYQVIPVPGSAAAEAAWPIPEEQSSGWVYDVFTPPKIFIGADGQFTAEGWEPPEPPKPFGVYLAEIAHKPYRVQIQGFSGDRTKPEDCVLFLYDVERQLRFFIRSGEEDAEAQIKVLDFTIERRIDANNNVEVIATATILDQRSGESVQLVDGQQLFDDGVTVVMRSEEDPAVLIELAEADAAFETAAGRYILKQINLEESTVSVEKLGTDESDAEVRTLSIATIETPAATPAVAAPAQDGFDFTF